ncbi:MAG: hypothetical protein AAF937_10595 [Planctomycetota bacterium]
MSWLTNNLNWLIYVFVLVIPVVSSVGKWLQQQAAKKQAEAEKRRRADAQLRTGRAEPDQTAGSTGTASASASAREEPPENFAERRRRQIEELKRRQEAAERQRDAAQRTASTGTVPAPTPTPVPPRGPARTARRPARQDTRRQTSAPVPPAPTADLRIEQPSPEIENLAARFEREANASRAQAHPAQASDFEFTGGRLDRETLRKAVVLAEILAPPVGMRDAADRPI